MITPLRSLFPALVLLGPATAVAQTVDQLAAYQALVRTPIGAVTPIVTRTMLALPQNGAHFGVRFGYLGASTANGSSGSNFAATAVLPAGLNATVSLTAGLTSQYCSSGCGSRLMVGAGGDMFIGSTVFGSTAQSPKLTISVAGELGYSQRSPGSFVSGYVGLPIALVPNTRPNQGLQFVPFVTPGFGFANASGGVTLDGSGTRIVFGGGVAMFNSGSSVTVNAGFQHVGIEGGTTMFGLAVVLGR